MRKNGAKIRGVIGCLGHSILGGEKTRQLGGGFWGAGGEVRKNFAVREGLFTAFIDDRYSIFASGYDHEIAIIIVVKESCEYITSFLCIRVHESVEK